MADHKFFSTSATTNDASAVVQNFLRSLQGNQALGSQQQTETASQAKPYTTLPDLLPPSNTLPVIESAPKEFVDQLLSYLPPTLLLLAQEIDDASAVDPTSETAKAAIEALSLEQKKDILRKTLRSPQFSQSLGSLTVALRDGGLPTISDALKIKVENGGFMRRGSMPLGGGEAVEAFIEGVKESVDEERKHHQDKMQTD